MVNTNANALGIIFPNCYDELLPEMVTERTMASVPFAGRYRMIDFVLSSMVNSGINNVSVIVKKNYHSLMDHLGTGREWDLARKHGGLNIIPPYAEANVKIYNGRIEALASIESFLENQREKYVVMSDANLAINFDFEDLITRHVESGADVTMVYQRAPIPACIKERNHTMKVENGRVVELLTNDDRPGVQNISMNIYVMERKTLIQFIKEASARNLNSFERDILARNLSLLNVQAIPYTGYLARIGDRMVADGCIIEGEVEDSILFRGVKIKKGAKVKHCVLMQGTVVESGAEIEYIVTDKNVKITADKKLSGTDSFPVYVAKGHTV